MVIVTSHNPPEHNGFKFIKENEVRSFAKMKCPSRALAPLALCRPPEETDRMVHDTGAMVQHASVVLSRVDAEVIHFAGLTICANCANEAACMSTPYF